MKNEETYTKEHPLYAKLRDAEEKAEQEIAKLRAERFYTLCIEPIFNLVKFKRSDICELSGAHVFDLLALPKKESLYPHPFYMVEVKASRKKSYIREQLSDIKKKLVENKIADQGNTLVIGFVVGDTAISAKYWMLK